jgi:hypothetical protein
VRARRQDRLAVCLAGLTGLGCGRLGRCQATVRCSRLPTLSMSLATISWLTPCPRAVHFPRSELSLDRRSSSAPSSARRRRSRRRSRPGSARTPRGRSCRSASRPCAAILHSDSRWLILVAAARSPAGRNPGRSAMVSPRPPPGCVPGLSPTRNGRTPRQASHRCWRARARTRSRPRPIAEARRHAGEAFGHGEVE